MPFQFLPALTNRLFNRDTPTSHAVAGSTAAMAGGGAYASVFSGQAGGDWDVERAVREGLERVIWVARCVHVIASNQNQLKMVVRQGDPDTGTEVDDPNLFSLLNRRANSYEDALQFRYRLSAQALLSKRGVFIEVVRDAFGVPRELHLLPPHLVEPIPDPDKFTDGFRLQTPRRGEVVIPNNRVLWLRLQPHPIDPYCQTTPLTAAGLAVDTDFLARWYNRNFLLNDGRPGLLINIQNLMGANDADEIKRRFSGGPRYAGRTTVLESDGVTVQDLAASPRDMEWLNSVKGSKDDILLAFGVPESVMGNASGRTFDNADAEKENFWDATEVPHCNPIARCLDPLTGSVYDDKYIGFDYDSVDVLQRQKRARHDKKLAEFQAGVCTIDDYFEATGRDRWNVPGTRVLIQTNGLIVAQSSEDEAVVKNMPVIGVAQQQQVQMQQLRQMGTVGGGMGGGQQQLMDSQSAASESKMRARALVERKNILGAARQLPPGYDGESSLEDMLRIDGESLTETKDTEILEAEIVHPYESFRMTLESQLDGVMTSWANDQARIIPERLEHVKSREGTRFWTNKDGSTIHPMEAKALNPRYAVDTDRWASNLQQDMAHVMRRAGMQAMKSAAEDMHRQGVLAIMHKAGRGNPRGRSTLGMVYGNQANALTAVQDLLVPLNDIVTKAARRHSDRIATKIADMEANGASMTAMKNEVKRMAGMNSTWRKQLATFLTTSLYEGAQERTYMQAGKGTMLKTWQTMDDERVRTTHERVDGETKSIGQKFRVGNSRMSYPCSPEGSIEETAGCRCHMSWSLAPAFQNRMERVLQSV